MLQLHSPGVLGLTLSSGDYMEFAFMPGLWIYDQIMLAVQKQTVLMQINSFTWSQYMHLNQVNFTEPLTEQWPKGVQKLHYKATKITKHSMNNDWVRLLVNLQTSSHTTLVTKGLGGKPHSFIKECSYKQDSELLHTDCSTELRSLDWPLRTSGRPESRCPLWSNCSSWGTSQQLGWLRCLKERSWKS